KFEQTEKNLTKTFDNKFEQTEKNLTKTFDNKFQRVEENLSHTFNDKFKQVEQRLLTQIDRKFAESSKDLNRQLQFHEKLIVDRLEEKFEIKQKGLRNDILNFKDEVLTEVKDLRQEVTVTSARVTKLEKTFLAN
ncbi:hypothetical protein GW844_01500, partial [bacterium]|nr:hypothetical protein [bacterium]